MGNYYVSRQGIEVEYLHEETGYVFVKNVENGNIYPVNESVFYSTYIKLNNKL